MRGFALDLQLPVTHPDFEQHLQLEFAAGVFVQACPFDSLVEQADTRPLESDRCVARDRRHKGLGQVCIDLGFQKLDRGGLRARERCGKECVEFAVLRGRLRRRQRPVWRAQTLDREAEEPASQYSRAEERRKLET